MLRHTLAWLAAAAMLYAPATLAEVASYTLVKDKSALKFIAIQNGAPLQGAFSNFTADIHFDPKQLDKSSVKVEVDTGSVTAASDDIANTVKLPEWLSTAAFPKATFTSTKITRLPQSDDYYADGQLTLRDKTVPVTLNFQFEHFDDKLAIATGFVTLQRNEFGVGQGQWAKDDVVKNAVRVEFRITAEKH